MSGEKVDVAVVGAGAAGLSAAGEAARLGAQVALIDDSHLPGGQYFRQVPPNFKLSGAVKQDKDSARFNALCSVIDSPLISYRAGATVWDIVDPLTLAIANGKHSCRIRAGAIVIATGARDRAIAFPGWTLPGVMTAGGLQNLIKGMSIVPPGPVVVAGNGPLLLVAAASLVNAGVRVTAVVEASNQPWRGLREMTSLAHAPRIVRLAIKYRLALLKAGTPVLRGHTVVAAHGEPSLSTVDIAAIDSNGKIDHQNKRQIEAQTLVTGFGLTPSTELARLVGASESYQPHCGGATVVRDQNLMTSVTGVFAAGDGASIGGVELSLVEGRIAGINASLYAGKACHEEVRSTLLRNRRIYRRLNRFRAGIERIYETPFNWLNLLTPTTIVCRCEDVTLGELDLHRNHGVTSPFQLKAATRIGMGRCQGRNCLDTLCALTGRHLGIHPENVPMPRSRQPARPILLGDLLHEKLPDPELPDDPHLPRRR